MPLQPGDIHVWFLHLDSFKLDIAQLMSLLDPMEKERAERFRHEHDRHCFALSRGGLRLILATQLGMAPEKIQYFPDSFGKLALAPHPNHQLRFSISRSVRCAMIAIARDIEIGVDVERMRPLPDILAVADTILSKHEKQVFQSLGANDRLPAFYKAWTQKEAYLKGCGLGLRRPPHVVEVNVDPAAQVETIRDHVEPRAQDLWSLKVWNPAADYTAALAMKSRNSRVIRMPATDGFWGYRGSAI
jgi:4'-phosphopantetheinyl transferase